MTQATNRKRVRDSFSLGQVFVGRALGIAGCSIALALLLRMAGYGT